MYNVMWENEVEDLFATMLAMVIIVVDDYVSSANIIFNGVYMIFIVLTDIQ